MTLYLIYVYNQLTYNDLKGSRKITFIFGSFSIIEHEKASIVRFIASIFSCFILKGSIKKTFLLMILNYLIRHSIY